MGEPDRNYHWFKGKLKTAQIYLYGQRKCWDEFHIQWIELQMELFSPKAEWGYDGEEVKLQLDRSIYITCSLQRVAR